MIVFFDNVVFELQRAGGISVYWSELLSRHNAEESVFFGRDNENIFAAGLSLRQQSEVYPSWFSRRYLPFWPKSGCVNLDRHIFHSSYLRYSSCLKAINVTTVHDFTYEYYSHGIRRWVHGLQKKQAVRKSAGIICVSENTRRDLLKFYPWVDEGQVRVIYNGVGDEFHPVEDPLPALSEELGFVPDKPFLIFVGDRTSYKNFDIFVGLASALTEFDLVVVGGKPFSEDELNKCPAFTSKVKHFRGVSSGVLNLLYNAAFCLVYPSAYEGFGIPVLEAMKAGCPVVSTNLSSIPEVAGDAALLVENIHVASFAEKIMQLFDESVRRNLLEKGYMQASRFSWDRCFQETYAFYQELWERSDL